MDEPRPPSVRLRPPHDRDEAAFLACHRELLREDFNFALGWEPGVSWNDYLSRLERERAGLDLAAGRVPASMLAAELDGEIVGRLSLRHELNSWLAHEGGHIGFAVLPRYRRKGIATTMLGQGGVIARSLGVARVLLTCDDANVGSAAVIESCGGVLESVVEGERRRAVRRYWID